MRWRTTPRSSSPDYCASASLYFDAGPVNPEVSARVEPLVLRISRPYCLIHPCPSCTGLAVVSLLLPDEQDKITKSENDMHEFVAYFQKENETKDALIRKLNNEVLRKEVSLTSLRDLVVSSFPMLFY